jgi:hypothetical protein
MDESKIKEEFAKLRQMYNEDPKQQSFNALVLGEMGSGKTFLLRTARLPVHIDSFDPGGTKGLRDEIGEHKIIPDTRYESEDRLNPSMYQIWKTEFMRRKTLGYFEAIGTYCLDSSTRWAEAIMNRILQKAGIPGEPPRFTKDYTPQKIEIQNMMNLILDLPCDCLITGHLEPTKDEATGRVIFRYMTTGKGALIIPTLFDEVWAMDPKETSSGVTYRILTENTGMLTARSRLSKGGLLETYEEPNIKKILTKVGMLRPDKPLFN